VFLFLKTFITPRIEILFREYNVQVISASSTTCMACARFQVLTAVNVKIIVLKDMAPCRLVERYRHLEGTCGLRLYSSLKMGAAETAVLFYDYTASCPRRQQSLACSFYNAFYPITFSISLAPRRSLAVLY
jgi:hypothetical protein